MSTPYNKKQQVCRNFAAGLCTRRNCTFAHVSGAGGGGGKSGGGGGNAAAMGGSQIFATVLKLLLEKAQNDVYVPEEKRLIISNFKASPDIQSMVSSIDFNTTSFCDALCSAIADKLGPTGVDILDVSSNQIRSLTHLTNAMKKFGLHTNLKCLSVQDNLVQTTDFTTALQPFPNLEQLVMLGNPVVNNADYRQVVRKRLPNLVGLDKEPIRRPPLGLPWPLPSSSASSTADAARMGLEFVSSYFNVLNVANDGSNSVGGLDAIIDKYHPQAVFSFSYVNEAATVKWEGVSAADGNANNNNRPSSSNALGDSNNAGGILTSPNRGGQRTPLPSKDVLRDVTALRVKQSEGNHNITKGVKKDNVGRGRAEVTSKLSHLIYQRSFIVDHKFHTAVNCAMLNEGIVPYSLIVVTMHGYMTWRHRSTLENNNNNMMMMGGNPAPPPATDPLTFTRVFDRTMTLVPNPANDGSNPNLPALLIANDMIELRPNADDPLFFADNEARVAMVARKFGLPPAIAYACMSLCERYNSNSDNTWFGILSELQTNVPMSLLEMVAQQLGAQDVPFVVNVARLMARRQMSDVNAAAQIIQAAGGDVEAVQ